MAQSSLGSPGLLSAGAQAAGDIAADRSFARDLNLDQIVAAIAGDREERDLITRVLFAPLRDADAVRYRQEVFQDLENPALFGEVQRFSGLIGEVRAHLRQTADMRERYQREGWLLDAAAIYCGAVRSWPDTSPRRRSTLPACWPSGTTWLPTRPRPGSPP